MLSVVSVWEMQIKMQLGKLRLEKPLPNIIHHQQEKNQLQILPIALPAVFMLDNLPLHHRDPFDRLLIAQAKVDHLFLVSNDQQFKQYTVSLLWE